MGVLLLVARAAAVLVLVVVTACVKRRPSSPRGYDHKYVGLLHRGTPTAAGEAMPMHIIFCCRPTPRKKPRVTGQFGHDE
jgi:hypothetical protein